MPTRARCEAAPRRQSAEQTPRHQRALAAQSQNELTRLVASGRRPCSRDLASEGKRRPTRYRYHNRHEASAPGLRAPCHHLPRNGRAGLGIACREETGQESRPSQPEPKGASDAPTCAWTQPSLGPPRTWSRSTRSCRAACQLEVHCEAQRRRWSEHSQWRLRVRAAPPPQEIGDSGSRLAILGAEKPAGGTHLSSSR